MSNTVNLLKQPNVSDIKILIYKVAKDILEPYMDTPDRSLRQKYGDHLVDIGAVPHLTKLHQVTRPHIYHEHILSHLNSKGHQAYVRSLKVLKFEFVFKRL